MFQLFKLSTNNSAFKNTSSPSICNLANKFDKLNISNDDPESMLSVSIDNIEFQLLNLSTIGNISIRVFL